MFIISKNRFWQAWLVFLTVMGVLSVMHALTHPLKIEKPWLALIDSSYGFIFVVVQYYGWRLLAAESDRLDANREELHQAFLECQEKLNAQKLRLERELRKLDRGF